MKAIVAVAMLLASAPAVVVAAADEPSARSEGQRRICTRIERQGASRLAHTRVCLTADEWRERLGPDWRQQLAGNTNLEDDMDSIENRTKAFSDVPKPATPR